MSEAKATESSVKESKHDQISAEERAKDPKMQEEPYMSKDSKKGAPSLSKFGSEIGGQLRSFVVATMSIFDGKKKAKTAEEIEAEEKIKRELKAKEAEKNGAKKEAEKKEAKEEVEKKDQQPEIDKKEAGK